jgi:hypothetical protein
VSLLALAAFSDDERFVRRLLSECTADAQHVLQTIMMQVQRSLKHIRVLHQEHKQLLAQHEAAVAASAVSKPKRSSASRGSPPPLSPPVYSADFYLSQHRLLCCLTILENATHHDAVYFERMCELRIDTGAAAADAMSDASSAPHSMSGAQLLFDVLAFYRPNIVAHQSRASPDVASALSAMSSSLFPSMDDAPIAHIFSLLRLMVNVTNRNAFGIRTINAKYMLHGEKTEVSH